MSQSIVFSATVPNLGPLIGVVAARVYRLVPGRRAEALPNADGFASTTRSLLDDDEPLDDTAMGAVAKPMTDVVLRATAHPRERIVRALDTGVEIGRARKVVRACGARTLRVERDRGVSISEPEAFETMPVTWTRAYGGHDARSERAGPPRWSRVREPDASEVADAIYPRNARGVGYFVGDSTDGLDGAAMPNLEDPADPITPDRILAPQASWLDRPAPAAYAPIDLLTFPRVAFLMVPKFTPPSRPVHEIGAGALTAADLASGRTIFSTPDLRLYNAAPAGLAVCRLEGHERLKLWNLHPRYELLECDLPGERPKVTVELPGCPVRSLEPLLQTVLVEPDEDRVTLTWAARLPTAVEYPDDAVERVRHSLRWHS